MVDFSKLGVSEDTIREYKQRYGDDAERMLMERFGGGNRGTQEEGTSQQNEDIDMSDRNAAM